MTSIELTQFMRGKVFILFDNMLTRYEFFTKDLNSSSVVISLNTELIGYIAVLLNKCPELMTKVYY